MRYWLLLFLMLPLLSCGPASQPRHPNNPRELVGIWLATEGKLKGSYVILGFSGNAMVVYGGGAYEEAQWTANDSMITWTSYDEEGAAFLSRISYQIRGNELKTSDSITMPHQGPHLYRKYVLPDPASVEGHYPVASDLQASASFGSPPRNDTHAQHL
jgi:hypothetical protein